MPSEGVPDPGKSLFIFASGRKGSGKSHVCRAWFDSYPYDKVVIDVTHDVRKDFRAEGAAFTEIDAQMMPTRLPAPDYDSDEERDGSTFLVAPDMGSATWLDDVDRVIGLCLGRGKPTLLWVDEFGEVTKGSRTPPNMRRALHHGRHDRLSLLLACPRPMDVDPLGLAQADLVYTFRTPQVYDRQRIADTIGLDRGEFDDVNLGLAQYWHTLFDARDGEGVLEVRPPLPPRRAGLNSYAPI